MAGINVLRRLPVIFGLSLLFAYPALGQSKTSKGIDGLVGPVHSVTTESATFSSENGVWVEGPREAISFIIYDTDGNDGRFGKGLQSPVAGEVKSRYDDKGREIEQVYENRDGSILVKRVFKYDGKDRKTEETDYEADGSQMRRAVFTFDEYGNTSSMSFYDERDTLTRKLTWTFDSKGNRTEWTESILRGNELSLFCKITDHYDDKGNPVEEIQYGNPEGRVTKQMFRYEFDAMGNWIKRDREWRAVEVSSGQSYTTHRITDYRTISYYPQR